MARALSRKTPTTTSTTDDSSTASTAQTIAIFNSEVASTAERIDDLNRLLDEVRGKVMDEAIESYDLYGHTNERVLEGDELRAALRKYDALSMIQERVIVLRKLQPQIDHELEGDPADSVARELASESAGLSAILFLSEISLVRCLRNTAFAMGLDPTPFTIVKENLTTESRASALALAELMALHSVSSCAISAKDSEQNQFCDEPALTETMQIVMRAMKQIDGSRLLSAAAIREELDTRLNVETVRRVVKNLEARGYAERPEGLRAGFRLTRAGRLKAGKIEV